MLAEIEFSTISKAVKIFKHDIPLKQEWSFVWALKTPKSTDIFKTNGKHVHLISLA